GPQTRARARRPKENGRPHRAPAATREPRARRGLDLDLTRVGKDPAAAAAENDRRARHAADGMQKLMRARIGFTGGEDQGQIGSIGPAALERRQRCLECRIVGRRPSRESGSRGDHDWTLAPFLLTAPAHPGWWALGDFLETQLVGYQASPRGGIVRIRVAGDRVKLGGKAVTVLRGEPL